MKITIIGRDYIIINENNLPQIPCEKKIHLIKIDIKNPTKDYIDNIINMNPYTNRYVISSSSNIKIYNDIFKESFKKYYVENDTNVHLISFLRKNNKILLNFNNLNTHNKQFANDETIISDILRNCEVVQANKVFYEKWKNLFSSWPGNLILTNG